jgi:intein/homing endonuclease
LGIVDIYDNIGVVMEQGADMIEYYRSDPVMAAYDLLNIDLAPIQCVILRDMWFKNFTITVAGRGCGKSASVDSLSHIKDKGLCYLNEEFPPIPSFLRNGETLEIDDESSIYTSIGFRNITKLSLEKNIGGLELETNKGFVHRGSKHHPLLTIDENCNFVYKQIQDFKPGDRVCIQRGQNVFGNIGINKDNAYLMGLFIGDGMIANRYDHQEITTSDEEIKLFCLNYCVCNDVDYRVDEDKRTDSVLKIVFKQFDSFFDKYGVKRCLSYYKEVPKLIRHSNRETQINFLQGLFDTDGGFEQDRGTISYCSVSKKLAKEVQIMLLNFGITARLREKKTESDFGKAYIVEFGSNDIVIFRDSINFRLTRKRSLLENYINTKELNTNLDTVPYAKEVCYKISKKYREENSANYYDRNLPSLKVYLSNCKEYTYNKLSDFLHKSINLLYEGYKFDVDSKRALENLYNIVLNNYYFDVVKSMDEWQGDCYDFEMDMSGGVEPNYFCNGFINHNTFLLGVNAVLHALLYPGYRVGLMGPGFRQSLVLSDSYTTFWTDEGLKSSPIEFYNSIKEGDTLVQSDVSQNRIISKWKNPDRACRYIKTNKGFELSGTVDHAIKILDDDNNIVFKDLQDITKDDYIVIKYGFNYFGNNNYLPEFDFDLNWRTKNCRIPTELTPDLSYWMGLLVGDGCVSVSATKRKQRVNFTNEDRELLKSFERYLAEYFVDDVDNIDVRSRKHNKSSDITYFSKKLVQFLLACGFTKITAIDKKVPYVIKRSSKYMLCSFLSGLFDTDGHCYIQNHDHYNSCEVSLNTSSLQLANEVQSILLNIGIVSSVGISKKAGKRKLNGRTKYSICATAYKVRITGVPNIIKFRDTVGFRCEHKFNKLNNFILSLKDRCRNTSICVELGVLKDRIDSDTDKFLSYRKSGLYFVKMKESNYFFAPTIDAEVENEHCYFAGGFINHNSKFIFNEVEKIYQRSSIVREACVKGPVRGADTHSLEFRGTNNSNGSYIAALPVGVDGSKIRGSRFYLIEIDELAQMQPDIIDMVIRPMAAVSSEPMQRVRERERQNELIRQGLANKEDFVDESANKMVMASSGYFKFNHMWDRMRAYWKAMRDPATEKKYAVHQVPYQLMPEAFLDMENINSSRLQMSSIEFRMEYEAAMVSDSDGFFKASALDACTANSDFSLQMVGAHDKKYVMGMDPNQGGSAACGVVIVEVGDPHKLVYVNEIKGETTQQMTMAVQDLCSKFNVIKIFMDSQGGGKPIRDLLQEGYGGKTPILDIDDDLTKGHSGKRILQMVNPTVQWINDANFDTLALIEHKGIRFPVMPREDKPDPISEKLYEEVKVLKSQMLNIVVTQTARGSRHFDTPTKGQNKDLYSAIILAGWGVREMGRQDMEQDQILHSQGLVRQHGKGSQFARVHNSPGESWMKDAIPKRRV